MLDKFLNPSTFVILIIMIISNIIFNEERTKSKCTELNGISVYASDEFICIKRDSVIPM